MIYLRRELQAVLARTGILAQQHHHLEGNGVVKVAQIQPDGPLHLLQTVDERIAMDIELASRLG